MRVSLPGCEPLPVCVSLPIGEPRPICASLPIRESLTVVRCRCMSSGVTSKKETIPRKAGDCAIADQSRGSICWLFRVFDLCGFTAIWVIPSEWFRAR